MSERLPRDEHAKLDSRVGGNVVAGGCRAAVGRPNSLQLGADAFGKGGVRRCCGSAREGSAA